MVKNGWTGDLRRRWRLGASVRARLFKTYNGYVDDVQNITV